MNKSKDSVLSSTLWVWSCKMILKTKEKIFLPDLLGYNNQFYLYTVKRPQVDFQHLLC